MRIFALSDIHVDYQENKRWVLGLSEYDYKQDILILAGDISEHMADIGEVFQLTRKKFHEVLFTPGNHDLWVRENALLDSFKKLDRIRKLALETGVRMEPFETGGLSIVPLYGWYDYSFGQPTERLMAFWMDYVSCKWPLGYDEASLTRHFLAMNDLSLKIENERVISFSHYVPRIDLMPDMISNLGKMVFPVLGTSRLEEQIREVGSTLHIYGHSHVNANIVKDGIRYINNAFGYPYETSITKKVMLCITEI